MRMCYWSSDVCSSDLRVPGEGAGIDVRLGAGAQGGLDLAADEVGGPGPDHGAQGRPLVQRIAKDVAARRLDEALDEGPVEVAVDVDPLDAAADRKSTRLNSSH